MADPRRDSILAHTLARVMLSNGVQEATDVSRWKAARAIPKASRITAFLVQWSLDGSSNSAGELEGLDEYRMIWNESERSAYRHQAEFREAWGAENFRPLVDAIKSQLGRTARHSGEKPNVARAMTLEITV